MISNLYFLKFFLHFVFGKINVKMLLYFHLWPLCTSTLLLPLIGFSSAADIFSSRLLQLGIRKTGCFSFHNHNKFVTFFVIRILKINVLQAIVDSSKIKKERDKRAPPSFLYTGRFTRNPGKINEIK